MRSWPQISRPSGLRPRCVLGGSWVSAYVGRVDVALATVSTRSRASPGRVLACRPLRHPRLRRTLPLASATGSRHLNISSLSFECCCLRRGISLRYSDSSDDATWNLKIIRSGGSAARSRPCHRPLELACIRRPSFACLLLRLRPSMGITLPALVVPLPPDGILLRVCTLPTILGRVERCLLGSRLTVSCGRFLVRLVRVHVCARMVQPIYIRF